MHKIDKFLKKLRYEERLEIERIVELIVTKNLEGLDVKKLKGAGNLFRIRRGRIRIVYGITADGVAIILSVDYRNDTTYNF